MATTLEMPELLTQAELLAVLKISRASLNRWLSLDDTFPVPRKIGRQNRYDAAEVKAWVEAQPRRAASG